jgi:hypothetical protein
VRPRRRRGAARSARPARTAGTAGDDPAHDVRRSTDADAKRAVKAALGVARASLKTRTARRLASKATTALPFAFSEPGRVELRILAGRRVIAAGSRSSAVNGRQVVTLELNASGRKLVKRAKQRLEVTIRAAFTPSRSGARTQTVSTSVTLRRR